MGVAQVLIKVGYKRAPVFEFNPMAPFVDTTAFNTIGCHLWKKFLKPLLPEGRNIKSKVSDPTNQDY